MLAATATFRAERRSRGRRDATAPRDAGTSSVELVITMPALLLAVLMVLQFGLVAHAQHVAAAAARDGVQAARAYGGTDQDGRQHATDSLEDLGPTILRDPSVEVTRTSGDVIVTVSGHATSILGGLFSFGIHEQARGEIERFIPATSAATSGGAP
ncbi:TadE/TadG family type IV pilus assembly protein [Sporichthya polymorpha]|uniref:TadE/TadG family type IV pilus assembly protein n=1 Tax=Sporichthya polymorpha TaxID=35751 RepID=UPI00036F1B34|nr:TadE/TadG family type IV pilus assembly protein [Sporichthya polymorpha]